MLQLEVGAFVAAFSDVDKCWYRARIVSLEMNEKDAAENRLVVEFVDFGDTATLKLQDVATLRPNFFSMKLQAIECRLSEVMPYKYPITTLLFFLFQFFSPNSTNVPYNTIPY